MDNLPLLLNEPKIASYPLPRLLRLQFRGRYTLAVMNVRGTVLPTLFWSMDQALLASGLHEDLWDSVETEIFSLILDADVARGHRLFAVQRRRGSVSRVVVWGPRGMLPVIYDSLTDAEKGAAVSYGESVYSRPSFSAPVVI